jgi:YVTN family beta-propeller protein
MVAVYITRNKYYYLIALSLGATIVVSLAMVAFRGVSAQSIETLTSQPKVGSPQIKVGGGSAEAIAVNDGTNKVYVYSPTNGTISIINSNVGSMVKNIRVGKYTPLGEQETMQENYNPIAIDSNNRVYLADAGSNAVTVIDGDNDTVIAHIKVGERPFSIAINPFFPGKIYVGEHNTISVINGSDYKKRPHNIFVSGLRLITPSLNTDLLYVANETAQNERNGTFSMINASDDTIILPTKVGRDPYDILPGSSKIYVANRGSGTVSVINGSNTVVRDISVEGGPSSMITLDGKVYVATPGGN